jgi:hypothetical protein
MFFNFLLSALIMSGGASPCPEGHLPGRTSQESNVFAEKQEEDFQKGLNSLFENELFDIDTSTWNNSKINTGHFDSENWPDTARIRLVDPALGRQYVHPFKNCINSNFGPRGGFWHFGVDIHLSRGDTVCAALDGIIRVLQYDRHGFGKVVVIRHYNGIETIYGHLSRECVAVNQAVHAGQVIGLGGNTGRSTGAHLHFEMRFFGEPFDPNRIIDFEKYELKNDTLVLTRTDFAYLSDLRKAQWHVVKKGETLGRIARLYHTSVQKLCELNRVSGRTIMSVGRRLLVRAAPPPGDSKLSLTSGQSPKG